MSYWRSSQNLPILSLSVSAHVVVCWAQTGSRVATRVAMTLEVIYLRVGKGFAMEKVEAQGKDSYF